MENPIQSWDNKYANDTFYYGIEPNAWLVENLKNFPAHSILFPAEGEGRNAVYAAKLGWNVSAFDFSEEGKNKATLLATNQKVELSYKIASAEDVEFDITFSAIGFFYSHFPGPIKIQCFQRLENYLSVGGTVILELFSKNQIEYQNTTRSGGPKDLFTLWDIEEVKIALPNIKWQVLEEVIYELNEGPGHQGMGSVIRGIGQKVG